MSRTRLIDARGVEDAIAAFCGITSAPAEPPKSILRYVGDLRGHADDAYDLAGKLPFNWRCSPDHGYWPDIAHWVDCQQLAILSYGEGKIVVSLYPDLEQLCADLRAADDLWPPWM